MATLALVLGFLLSLTAGLAFDVDVPVEHSFGGGFVPAGRLEGSVYDTESGYGHGGSLTLRRKDLSDADRASLAQLVKENGNYRLRVPAFPGEASGQKVQAVIPARCLVAGGLQDALQVHASPRGHFLGLSYDFSRLPCDAQQQAALPAELSFPEESRVRVALPAPTPILRKPEKLLPEGTGKKPGQGAAGKGVAGKGPGGDSTPPEEDNRPWIVKNWMITVPASFVILNVIGQFMAPPETGGSGQAAAAPAGGRRRG